MEFERKRLGLSYEKLAEAMSEKGCSIQGSAIYKIEREDPPRKISVNELAAMSMVFGVSPTELLQPPEIASSKRGAELWERYQEAGRRLEIARRDQSAAFAALTEFLDADVAELLAFNDNIDEDLRGLAFNNYFVLKFTSLEPQDQEAASELLELGDFNGLRSLLADRLQVGQSRTASDVAERGPFLDAQKRRREKP